MSKKQLRRRIEELERRVAELEQRPSFIIPPPTPHPWQPTPWQPTWVEVTC